MVAAAAIFVTYHFCDIYLFVSHNKTFFKKKKYCLPSYPLVGVRAARRPRYFYDTCAWTPNKVFIQWLLCHLLCSLCFPTIGVSLG